jgi:hypothetical protein
LPWSEIKHQCRNSSRQFCICSRRFINLYNTGSGSGFIWLSIPVASKFELKG